MQAQKRSSTFQCRVAATEKQDALSDREGKTRLWKVELRRASAFLRPHLYCERWCGYAKAPVSLVEDRRNVRHCLTGQWLSALYRFLAHLFGADADGLFDVGQEDFPVADFAGLGCFDDGCDCLVCEFVGDDGLEFDLR